MKYTDEQMSNAIEKGIFTEDQVKDFKEYIQGLNDQTTKPQKVLYYGAGLLIISAVTWLMVLGCSAYGDVAVTLSSGIYFVAFSFLGYFVFFKKKIEVAGGLLLAIPIAVTPLLVFSLLQLFGVWSPYSVINYIDYYVWENGRWIILELATFVVAFFMLIETKFPFHVFLIAFTLWFFSIDIAQIIYGSIDISTEGRATISIYFGFLMIVAGYFIDLKFEKNYAFWVYFFGLITLVSGLSFFYEHTLSKLVALGFISVFLILLSVFLSRNIFLVFGTIGLVELLGRLSWEFFEDSAFFSIMLTFIGILLISGGMFFQKNKRKIDACAQNCFPDNLLKLRPKKR